MATAIASPAFEPRYAARNTLHDKWSAILRRGLWMALFIYAFVMIGVHFVHLRLAPTFAITITRNLLRRPDDFWRILGLSLFVGAMVGAFVVAALAAGVALSSVAVYDDRLRLTPAGWGRCDVMFRDIVGVELVTLSSWPRRGSFWSDVARQISYALTFRWMQHGMSQFFQSEATLVMVKVAGHRWVRAYMIDVDDPGNLLRALDAAIADYVGANGPEHMPAR